MVPESGKCREQRGALGPHIRLIAPVRIPATGSLNGVLDTCGFKGRFSGEGVGGRVDPGLKGATCRSCQGLSSGDKHWGAGTSEGACLRGWGGSGVRGADGSSVDFLPGLNPGHPQTPLFRISGLWAGQLERGGLPSQQVCRRWQPRDLGSNSPFDSYHLGGPGPALYLAVPLLNTDNKPELWSCWAD